METPLPNSANFCFLFNSYQCIIACFPIGNQQLLPFFKVLYSVMIMHFLLWKYRLKIEIALSVPVTTVTCGTNSTIYKKTKKSYLCSYQININIYQHHFKPINSHANKFEFHTKQWLSVTITDLKYSRLPPTPNLSIFDAK